MNLYHESVYRRLKALLAYHQKLVGENHDKTMMSRCERKIRRLVSIIESLNQGEAALELHR